jgi:hypothetical protein
MWSVRVAAKIGLRHEKDVDFKGKTQKLLHTSPVAEAKTF